jgi:cysteine synthase A
MNPTDRRGLAVIECIGKTPLIELRKIVPDGHARVFAKLEAQNPTGSMKDRMAVSVVDRALESGRLAASGTLVEYTGGSTGTSLAFVCAAYGINASMITSDAFSQEKRDHMRALGANVVEIPSKDGGITKQLIERMIERAAELSAVPGAFFADQFNNVDAIAGYKPLAEEAWAQSGGRIDAFVQSVGTAHCIAGVAEVLRSHNPQLKVVAVEPAESAVLSGGEPGAHDIEGIGAGFVPPLWRDDIAGDIAQVTTDDAKEMSRRLAREEALFAGTSSGANVVAALREAEKLGRDQAVLTIICDSGLKYLSTDLYRSR